MGRGIHRLSPPLRSPLLGGNTSFFVTILAVLFLTRLAAIMSSFALGTSEIRPTCLTVGAVFVTRVDLLLFVHFVDRYEYKNK